MGRHRTRVNGAALSRLSITSNSDRSTHRLPAALLLRAHRVQDTYDDLTGWPPHPTEIPLPTARQRPERSGRQPLMTASTFLCCCKRRSSATLDQCPAKRGKVRARSTRT